MGEWGKDEVKWLCVLHFYVPLGYKNVSHLSVGPVGRKETLKESLFLPFFSCLNHKGFLHRDLPKADVL